MTINVSPALPTNANGEIVVKLGTGGSTVTGHLPALNFPIDVAGQGLVMVIPELAPSSEVLTGFVSGAGTVSTSDTVLTAINKLDGNDQLKLNKAGTTTNDNAATGGIGELLTTTVAVGSEVSLSTGTAADVATLVLAAGDYDISAVVDYDLAGTTATLFTSAISLTANTLPTQAGGSGLGTDPMVSIPLSTTTVTAVFAHGIPPVRLSVAGSTTVHLVAKASFSAGTTKAYGTIRARRMR